MKSRSFSPAYIIALICILGLIHIVWLSFLCDDAFISFRYAKNLIEGHGLVFNAGERVEGYTNFLWVMIVAMILDAGGRPEVWPVWIGTVCGVGTLAAVMGYLRRKERDFLFAGLLLAANGGFAAWATGGLETSLFTLLVTLGLLSLLWMFETKDDQADVLTAPHPVWLSAGFLLLAALTRPEGVLITGLCGLCLLFQVARRRFDARMFLLWAAVWLVPYGAYFLWRYEYYGHLFPNTFYVKAAGLTLLPEGLEYLFYAFQRFYLYILLIPAVVLLIARRSLGVRKEALWFGAWIVVPYLAYVASVGGDFMDMFRFVVPVLPLVMLIIGQTWYAFFKFVTAQWSRGSAIGVVTALLLAAVGFNLFTSWDSQTIWYRHDLDSIGLLRKYAEDWTADAQYFKKVSLPTDTIAITAAGIIPYYTDLYTIDQLGLTAKNLGGYVSRDNQRPGHGLLASGKYLFQMRPQFIIGHPKMFPDSVGVFANVFIEESWYPELTRQYKKIQIHLTSSPPRYMSYALRNDVAAAVQEQIDRGAATDSLSTVRRRTGFFIE